MKDRRAPNGGSSLGSLFSKLARIATPGNGLKQRTIRSAMWVSLLRGCIKGLSLVQTVILARLLDPRDFGLYGIALLLLYTLDAFSQPGMESALIHKEGDIGEYLDTAWTINVLRGVLMGLLVASLAPLAALFFREPRVTSLLLVLAVDPVVSGLQNIGTIFFQKDLDFRKYFVLEGGTAVLAFGGTVVAAFLMRSVWALVIATVLYHTLETVSSFMLHPYRPKLHLDRAKAATLLGYGRWITGTKILKLFIMQGDDAFIGRMLGATSLGFYQLAYKISEAPMDEVNNVVSTVTFPAFSRLKNNVVKLRDAYLRSLQLNSSLAIPAAAGLLVLSDQVVKVLLGPKWLEVIPAIRVLVLLGVFKHMGNFGTLFKAVGRPDFGFYESIIRLSIMVMTIYPLTMAFGIVGTGSSVLVATVIARVWTTAKTMALLEAGYLALLRVLLVPALASIIMAIGVLGISVWLDLFNPVGLAAAVTIGVGLYVGVGLLIDKASGGELKANISDAIKSF